MCDVPENLVSTFQHENKIFQVFKTPTTYQHAEKSCECANAPSRTLALVKTSATFRKLTEDLEKISNKGNWRIGLRRQDGISSWADEDIMITTPAPIIPRKGDCYNIHISKSSAFFQLNECDSINAVSGYVCSQSDEESLPREFIQNTSTKKIQNIISHTGSNAISELSTTTAFEKNSEGASGKPSDWIIVLVVLVCILLLGLLVLLFKRRRQKQNRSENSILNRVTFGQVNPQNEDSDVQYATIDEFMDIDENTATNTMSQGNENISPVYETPPTEGEVYAVVNKRKSKDANATTSLETKEEITYAVVNKNKSQTGE